MRNRAGVVGSESVNWELWYARNWTETGDSDISYSASVLLVEGSFEFASREFERVRV